MTSLQRSLKYNRMRRLFTLLVFCALAMTACMPIRHALHVEMRYPSRSGIELSGKVISVVYLTDGNKTGDSFNASMAGEFASVLEKDYATGEGSIGVYSIQNRGGKYSHKDTLVNLLMDTGCDAVFLFDKVDMAKTGENSTKFSIKLYCFDAMNKDENVYSFIGNTVVNHSVESLETEAQKTGGIIAESFKSQWKHEQYSITYYEGDKWYDALIRTQAFDWKGAMDVWMELLSTKNLYKRSCAEYNIAVACYMLGDYSLSKEWLDRSDEDNELPVSAALRKRNEARMK